MHSYSDLSVLTTPSDAMDVELKETGEQKSWYYYYYESAEICVRLLIVGLFMCTTDRNNIILFFDPCHTPTFIIQSVRTEYESDSCRVSTIYYIVAAAVRDYSNKTFNIISFESCENDYCFHRKYLWYCSYTSHADSSRGSIQIETIMRVQYPSDIAGHTVFNLFCVDQKLPCINGIARGLMVQYFIW